jgi:hypothetical protein
MCCVCIYGLGLTLCVNVNVIMKFIYILFKYIRSIYIHIGVKPYKFNLCHVKLCKCTINKYIFMCQTDVKL